MTLSFFGLALYVSIEPFSIANRAVRSPNTPHGIALAAAARRHGRCCPGAASSSRELGSPYRGSPDSKQTLRSLLSAVC